MKDKLQNYLQGILGYTVELVSLPMPRGMILLFHAMYHLYSTTLLDTKCLFAVEKEHIQSTPRQSALYSAEIAQALCLPVVVVPNQPGPHDAQRLLAARVPYVIPGRSLFLPFLGLAITSRKQEKPILRSKLGNTAQLLVIGTLLKRLPQPLTLNDAQNTLKCSLPTLREALHELEHFGLGAKQPLDFGHGSHFHWLFEGKQLWDKAQEILFNPCRMTIGIEQLPPGLHTVTAAESALAEITMLAPAEPPVTAAFAADWNKLGIPPLPPAKAPRTLELWNYRPDIFQPGKMDPLSMALSLKNHPDPRVAKELETVLEKFPW